MLHDEKTIGEPSEQHFGDHPSISTLRIVGEKKWERYSEKYGNKLPKTEKNSKND